MEIMEALPQKTVLAGRCKILETIEAGTFRRHDLALDQIVTVRRGSLKVQGGAEFWHQKARQVALIQDSDLLNVLEVVSENSKKSIITELPRGCSVADFSGERSSLPWVERARALPATALTARKDPVALRQTHEVIREFDRDTGRVATAVLVMVILGAVGLAMQIKEPQLKVGDLDNVPFSRGVDRWAIQWPYNIAPTP